MERVNAVMKVYRHWTNIRRDAEVTKGKLKKKIDLRMKVVAVFGISFLARSGVKNAEQQAPNTRLFSSLKVLLDCVATK